MRPILTVGCTLVVLVLAVPCLAGSTTVSDGDFASGDWTFGQVTTNGPDATDYATVAMAPGTDPTLKITTNSYTAGQSVWGVALYDSFVFDPGVSGPLNSISLSLDHRGSTQAIDIVILQGGVYYGLTTSATTGNASSWTNFSTLPLGIAAQVHSWSSTDETFDNPVLAPDFSSSGGTMKFGFAAGNSISRTLTNNYDNWSVTLNHGHLVPLPSAALQIGFALLGLAVFRRLRRRK